MPACSRGDVLLVRYPFTDLSQTKVRPAIKRGIYTIHPDLIIKCVGQLSLQDFERLERSLFGWLGLGS